jgi:hypothetical protein
MPANLTPQYREAEKEFRQAKSTEEKIAGLEKMLRLIPKHKGTDHMQADLKHRLSRLRKEQQEGRGKGKKSGPVFKVDKVGAGQIAVLGAPNAGKSQFLAALTNAPVHVAEYPFATQVPQPGMVRFEDIQIQLIDTPPVTADYLEPWLPDLVRRADAAILLADLADDDMPAALDTVLGRLEAVKIALVRHLPAEPDPLRQYRRTAVAANKLDAPGAPERLEVLKEFFADRFDIWPLSAARGDGMAEVPRRLFDFLGLLRAYTKQPGKKADLRQPYTLPVGSTVLDLAVSIHRDFQETLKSARVWGSGKYDGIHVRRDHVLQDKDIVELQE